jgi:ubiquinone biosynthesis protein COQ4
MNLHPLRTAKALYSLARLVKNPDRLGEVFELSDALATREAMAPIVSGIASDPFVSQALEERRRLRIDLRSLRTLPKGTLGRAFAEHMDAAGLDPGALPDLASEDAIGFFRAHLYETHDVWHVVTGFGVDWRAELGLQAFYIAQIPGPLPLLLVAVGFVRSALYEPEATLPFLEEVVRGFRMGRAARPLFGVRWDELWDVPLAEVRTRLGVTEEDAQAGRVAALCAQAA